MSKFNWRKGFASGLIVGILSVVLLCVLAGLPPFTIDPSASGNACGGGNADNCANNAEQVPYGWYWLRRAFAVEDTIAQWIMMAFTIAAAALLLLTLKATQNMARDTRDIGQAQVRAYLDVWFNAEWIVSPSDQAVIGSSFLVDAKNNGATPAYNADSILILSRIQKGSDRKIIRSKASEEYIAGKSHLKSFVQRENVQEIETSVIISPGQTGAIFRLSLENISGRSISDVFTKHLEKDLNILVEIKAVYSDCFGKRYEHYIAAEIPTDGQPPNFTDAIASNLLVSAKRYGSAYEVEMEPKN